MKELAEQIASWLKDYAVNAGAEGYVVGLSGGVDSATAAALAVKGLGKDRVYGVIMPCHSDPLDQMLARQVAEWLDIDYHTTVLDFSYTALMSACLVPTREKRAQMQLAAANAKARMRMIVLYTQANTNNLLVLGTGNKTECLLGYFTKYGDGGVDVLPLGDLYKTEVWQLAKELGVPQQIIDRPPTAGLWEGQTDEEEIGMSYAEMDNLLIRRQAQPHRELLEMSPDISEKEQLVMKLMEQARHKLQMPPIFRRVSVGNGVGNG